jgi:hypothetical protein
MLHSKGLEGNQGDVDYINRTLFDFLIKHWHSKRELIILEMTYNPTFSIGFYFNMTF